MNFNRLKLISNFNIISRCSTQRHKSYRHTILLPQSDFPLRLNSNKLIERDRLINEVVNSNYLYNWQRQHLTEPEFILHDGPPYANGLPHMGHAINKILKDIILRIKILEGRKVHYVPGWDCHGLPIELKALKNQSNTSEQNPLQIRTKELDKRMKEKDIATWQVSVYVYIHESTMYFLSLKQEQYVSTFEEISRDFAREAIVNQKKVFTSWGILGDWNNAYNSFSIDYLKNELKQFFELYSKNSIYRDIKPIYWSPSTKTALAESELEYNQNHRSPSIYVQFEIERLPKMQFLSKKRMYALIWTTTPWTLPSNQAVCYNPNLTYCLCTKDSGKTIFITAIDLIDELKKILGCDVQILATLPDGILSEAKYRHPIYRDQILSFFIGSHVDAKKGTGLVHTAPAHGHEDYLVALKNNISIIDLVDDNGCYLEEAGPDLAGKFVLNEGNETVIRLLNNNLVNSSEIVHSYPYDWRTNKPVIMKASAQWFLNTNLVKSKAIDSLNYVNFIPITKSAIYKEEFLKQIEKRPFWCISRQRKWGVPIPVFYRRDTEQVVLNEDIINYQYKLLDEYGPDYWWELSEEKLLPENMDSSELKKGEDILDIWFDSGISWSKILHDKVADIYLEGGDQFNGWFYSSLITSLACRGVPPYKTLYIHGFAVDDKGLKMSKSLGNITDPIDVVEGSETKKPYGVDVLRWWVACHANQNSLVYVSDNVLQSCSDEVQKIRNVLRFAVAALKDYKFVKQENISLSFTDKYMLHILYEFFKEVRQDANKYAFHKIGKAVINFLTNEISAFYYTAIKDRLYCDSKNSVTRKSAQFVLFHIFETVSMAIAPILPHLAEELYIYLPAKRGDTYFTSSHEGIHESWKNEDVKEIMNIILDIRKNFNIQVGTSSSIMDVKIIFTKKIFDEIESIIPIEDFHYEIGSILQCATADLRYDTNQVKEYQLNISKSEKCSCPRCRRVQSDKKSDLCYRCSNVLNSSDLKNKENLNS